MQTTRWAMVGTGFMLQLIGHDFARTGNVALQVIVSRTAERATSAAREFGFPEGSDDLDAVLRRDDIDVVYVATPHSEHFTQAKAAIEAGKHVLVEKSMTPSASSTTELCALAESRGVFAMEAMWTAFNPAVIELRRRVLAGQLGEVRVVHANFCTFVPYRPESRLWAKDLAGGSTLDQGVYTLTFAHMILGPPSSVTARGTVVHGVDAEVAVVLDYKSGSRGVCVSSLRAHSPLNAYIAGTEGCIEVPGAFWNASSFTQRSVGTNGAVEEFTYQREGAGYVPMLRAVSHAILNGQTQCELRTHEETIAVAETMDEALRQVHGA
jgi:predicted dehydrogenase